MLTNSDYDLLGVSPDASLQEIKKAYLDLVRAWHPDRFAGDPTLQKAAEEKLKRINVAYDRLQLLRRPSRKTSRDEPRRAPRQPETSRPRRPAPRRPADRTSITCSSCGETYTRHPKDADACDRCKQEFTAKEFLSRLCSECHALYSRTPRISYSVLLPDGKWICRDCADRVDSSMKY